MNSEQICKISRKNTDRNANIPKNFFLGGGLLFFETPGLLCSFPLNLIGNFWIFIKTGLFSGVLPFGVLNAVCLRNKRSK